jgi:hypothetical protein
MESRLLDWATRNTASPDSGNDDGCSGAKPGSIQHLDPELVEMILGRDETVVMRSLTSRIGNSRNSCEDEQVAIEQLEEIVEKIDSANNMAKMNLWPSVFEALALGDNVSSVLSLIGTAAQNDQEVQDELLRMGVLPKIIHALGSVEDLVARKAVYATSSMIQNNRNTFDAFRALGGIGCLQVLRERHPAISERVQFLLGVLESQYSDEASKS